MEKINYRKIISKHPWVIKKDQRAILSPDTDGLLCGLLLSHYLGWEMVGFYNGKTLLIKDKISTKQCIFLDMEILRKDVRSMGHHMNVHNINDPPDNYHRVMEKCINPNYIRGFDRLHNFSRKYPLGNIHLLMYILEIKYPKLIKINKNGLASLFFADGIWKILFKYTKNVLDWFNYLHTEKESVWWRVLKQASVIDLINEINNLLDSFEKIQSKYGHIDIDDFKNQNQVLNDTLNLLSSLTGWKYRRNLWQLANLREYSFTKKIYEGSNSNDKFLEIFRKKPLSLAMTEGTTIQYTLEKPDRLP